MKKFFSLTLTLAAMLSAMAVSAQAADYSFETDGTPEYYPSSITINLDRKAGQPVRLSLHLVPKLQ